MSDILHLRQTRFNTTDKSTTSLLFIGGEFACFILENPPQDKKIYGNTRIPEGVYEIKLRKEGGFHNHYEKKFPAIHKGMLELQDVPDFTFILIHIGNAPKNTDGCLLTGSSYSISRPNWISSSTNAYLDVYPKIADALEKGTKVFIEIIDVS